MPSCSRYAGQTFSSAPEKSGGYYCYYDSRMFTALAGRSMSALPEWRPVRPCPRKAYIEQIAATYQYLRRYIHRIGSCESRGGRQVGYRLSQDGAIIRQYNPLSTTLSDPVNCSTNTSDHF